jgi:hypothetical protein
MTKQISAVIVAACVALPSLGLSAALAKQSCSAAMPANQHGQWWSYRLIDGRKCWYEGKPGLSKSLLEWPAQASDKPAPNAEVASPLPAKPDNPLNSQAWAPSDSDTFEALWRARVEQH